MFMVKAGFEVCVRVLGSGLCVGEVASAVSDDYAVGIGICVEVDR